MESLPHWAHFRVWGRGLPEWEHFVRRMELRDMRHEDYDQQVHRWCAKRCGRNEEQIVERTQIPSGVWNEVRHHPLLFKEINPFEVFALDFGYCVHGTEQIHEDVATLGDAGKESIRTYKESLTEIWKRVEPLLNVFTVKIQVTTECGHTVDARFIREFGKEELGSHLDLYKGFWGACARTAKKTSRADAEKINPWLKHMFSGKDWWTYRPSTRANARATIRDTARNHKYPEEFTMFAYYYMLCIRSFFERVRDGEMEVLDPSVKNYPIYPHVKKVVGDYVAEFPTVELHARAHADMLREHTWSQPYDGRPLCQTNILTERVFEEETDEFRQKVERDQAEENRLREAITKCVDALSQHDEQVNADSVDDQKANLIKKNLANTKLALKRHQRTRSYLDIRVFHYKSELSQREYNKWIEARRRSTARGECTTEVRSEERLSKNKILVYWSCSRHRRYPYVVSGSFMLGGENIVLIAQGVVLLSEIDRVSRIEQGERQRYLRKQHKEGENDGTPLGHGETTAFKEEQPCGTRKRHIDSRPSESDSDNQAPPPKRGKQKRSRDTSSGVPGILGFFKPRSSA